LGLRLAWILAAQKNACGGRSNVMIGNMGLVINATHTSKARQKKQKKFKLGKEGGSARIPISTANWR
jgi:hypothetical protein